MELQSPLLNRLTKDKHTYSHISIYARGTLIWFWSIHSQHHIVCFIAISINKWKIISPFSAQYLIHIVFTLVSFISLIHVSITLTLHYITQTAVAGGTPLRGNLVMRMCCWFAKQEQHCKIQVISPWPCITVHSSRSCWFSGSNGCHYVMGSNA